MKAIEDLLRQRMGLDVASVGASLIERAVRLRMKALSLRRSEEYLARLGKSEAEWRELIESVVVGETWFFRDAEAFAALARMVVNEKLPRDPRSRQAGLRLLSAPSSTGEEPYSLAMALLDAGVTPDRFTIDALDISARALERAQRGVYGKNAFRGESQDFRDRHFRKVKDGFQISSRVRDCVRFHHGNLLEGGIAPSAGAYDFIFCRNLLIYFDRATQARALGVLRGWLAADGILFVGPAEMPLAVEHGFRRVNLPMTFACQRVDAPKTARKSGSTSALPTSDPTRRDARAFTPPATVSSSPAMEDVPPPATRHPVSEARPAVDLALARKLADAGQLDQALEIAEEYLRLHGPSAEVYYLLGLVRDARGETSAMDFYRKALYLQPDHYESLLQLALLMDKQGDAAGAKTFRRRAGRAKKESVES